MRTIHRDIVGGFIFSKDNKILLGKNLSGGVYEEAFVVPGGGVDKGETKKDALQREMLEETGIDISKAKITKINFSKGKHEKTLRDTKERVLVKMDFYDYRVDLTQKSDEISLKTEDDWDSAQWFIFQDLGDLNLSEPTRNTLLKTGIIST
jgi:8-oxo-dGTP pyrophosphatase MutT (NUDIX family)